MKHGDRRQVTPRCHTFQTDPPPAFSSPPESPPLSTSPITYSNRKLERFVNLNRVRTLNACALPSPLHLRFTRRTSVARRDSSLLTSIQYTVACRCTCHLLVSVTHRQSSVPGAAVGVYMYFNRFCRAATHPWRSTPLVHCPSCAL